MKRHDTLSQYMYLVCLALKHYLSNEFYCTISPACNTKCVHTTQKYRIAQDNIKLDSGFITLIPDKN